jgi:hypothetical protein
MVLKYEARFMELLRYAPHLNTEKTKFSRLIFGLSVIICEKVRILMTQTFHYVVQKALIEGEDIIGEGQRRTPARPMGQASFGA